VSTHQRARYRCQREYGGVEEGRLANAVLLARQNAELPGLLIANEESDAAGKDGSNRMEIRSTNKGGRNRENST